MSNESNSMIELKAQAYDFQQAAVNAQAQVKELSEALQVIAQSLNLEPDENGQLKLEDIVNTVNALVSAEKQDDKA